MAPAVRRGRPVGSTNKSKAGGTPRTAGRDAVTGKGLDLAAVLGGGAEHGPDQIVLLPVDLLDPDPENFYSLDGLDELAGNIELLGLMDPIRVRPNGERYTIVSGHRRRAAILLIRDGGSEQFKDGVPCIVEYGAASEAMRKLRLIYANSSTRQLTSAEQSKQAEEVTRLLYELKEQGVEFPGRMRDHVAQACGLTKSKIARLHAIRENLKPELLNCYDQGLINESAAYELQKLPMDVQRYLAGKKKVTDGQISGEGCKLCAERAERYLHPECKCPDGSACSHTLPRFYQTAVSSYWDCRGGCCLKCPHTENYCPYQCGRSKKQTEERRAKERSEREEAEKTEKDRREENRAKLAGQYMALSILAEDAGLKDSDVIHVPGALTLGDLKAKAASPAKISDYDARDPEVFDRYTYIGQVREFADLAGVSVDFLLGRTMEPKLNTRETEKADCHANAAALARNDRDGDGTAPEPKWQTGTPERAGRYFCRVKSSLDDEGDPAKEFRFDWDGETWFFTGKPIFKGTLVLGWWPLPDMEG